MPHYYTLCIFLICCSILLLLLQSHYFIPGVALFCSFSISLYHYMIRSLAHCVNDMFSQYVSGILFHFSISLILLPIILTPCFIAWWFIMSLCLLLPTWFYGVLTASLCCIGSLYCNSYPAYLHVCMILGVATPICYCDYFLVQFLIVNCAISVDITALFHYPICSLVHCVIDSLSHWFTVLLVYCFIVLKL